MKLKKLIAPLALLACMLCFQQVNAKNVIVVKDQYGIPYTKAYIAQQRQAQMLRSSSSATGARNLYINLPANVTGYYNWEITYSQSGNNMYTFTTNSSTDSYTPIGTVEQGEYDVSFTCLDYYPQGWDIQAFWVELIGNSYSVEGVRKAEGNAYYGAVTLHHVIVNDTPYDPWLQIDGGY